VNSFGRNDEGLLRGWRELENGRVWVEKVWMVGGLVEFFGILRFAQDDSKDRQQQGQTTARTDNGEDRLRRGQATARDRRWRDRQRQQQQQVPDGMTNKGKDNRKDKNREAFLS
jgi:hypothetical protein